MAEILIGSNLIELKKRVYTIGRSMRSHIKADCPYVSRYAATFYFCDEHKWNLIIGHVDVKNSTNHYGIRINDILVDATYGIVLNHNDLVHLSPKYYFQFFNLANDLIDEKSTAT